MDDHGTLGRSGEETMVVRVFFFELEQMDRVLDMSKDVSDPDPSDPPLEVVEAKE